MRNKKVKQESFHVHNVQGLQQEESDWNVSLIDHAVSADYVRWKESYLQMELETLQPNE